ncbi:MAG TPA: cytochrome c peroxidase [Vicinamibacterales bacterium]|nr:cytochrome c peroxidase [Vicinamibacterales bacterium]
MTSVTTRRARRRFGARGALSFWSLTAALVVGVTVTVATTLDSSTASAVARYKGDYRRLGQIPYPSHNAHTPAREQLGRTLFFDPRLSGSEWISCATCHNPGLSWGDGLPRAIGHGMHQLGRRTPTILNLAWAPALFWDGRAESLEEQALGPIAAAGEMNLRLTDMVQRLKSICGYRDLFERAYPREPISPETVAKAIATFERGVVSTQAPFDRWIDGDATAISSAAQRGFVLFNEKARCSVCHTGWRLTDDGFYDIGVAGMDVGRGKLTPGMVLTRYAFKTPTLRNVARRAPYLHDGSAATLEAVVDLYDRGGATRRPSLSAEIKPLDLTSAEKSALVAFLLTLTSPDAEARVPVLPR